MLALVLSACGGGSVEAPSPAAAPDASAAAYLPSSFPRLIQSPGFQLGPIADPPDRSVQAGWQRGRVLVAGGVPAASGLRVELVHAAMPPASQVLASTTTATDGSFSLPDTATVAPLQRQLRVSLADGTVLRAYATGWVEITVGTEVAVAEITRLRNAGAFTTHALRVAEISATQRALSDLWSLRFSGLPARAALRALPDHLRFLAPWNRHLERLASDTVTQGTGDILAITSTEEVRTQARVTRGKGRNAVTSAETFTSACYISGVPTPDSDLCQSSGGDAIELLDRYRREVSGLSLYPSQSRQPDVMRLLLERVGELRLLEFPYTVGTRVLINEPHFVFATTRPGAVRVTRRTYPATPVQAFGRTIQAVQVVIDYEIAMLDTLRNRQTDFLARERRWFTSEGWRVRAEVSTQHRNFDASTHDGADAVTSMDVEMRADAINGVFQVRPQEPFPGVADVVARGIAHRHAIYSAALDRVYVATADNGGQVLELDGRTLAQLRSVATETSPGRLAVAGDGSRLYVGLDGGRVAELRTSDLTLQRSFNLPVSEPWGTVYDRIAGLDVDPFDPARVLVLGDNGASSATGPVLVYREGRLLQRAAPNSSSDFGWSTYFPTQIAWSGARDQFMVASSNSMFRFRTGSPTAIELAGVSDVETVGWKEVGGRFVTSGGDIRDRLSLTALRSLPPGPFGLRNCSRFDAATALCEYGIFVGGRSPPYFVLMDFASGRFLGTYRTREEAAPSGCPDVLLPLYQSMEPQMVNPIGGGRALLSFLPRRDGTLCSLAIIRLRGVAP